MQHGSTLTGCLIAAAVALVTAAQPQSPRQFLLLDGSHLAAVRTAIGGGDTRLKAALASFEEDAQRALAMKPVSVMDKGVTPPSGTKHDYMSQAPYWWPDPSKPDGKPYIRRDGQRNPEINRITDHDNLGRLISAVSTLGLAYHLSRREDYAAHAALLVRTWFINPATRMNPHLQHGQGIPGINDGRGIGIIETRGLPALLDGVIAISSSAAWTTADEKALQVWMREYLKWLLESSHGKDESRNGNNHETYYDVQVAGLAFYTGQSDVARRTLEESRRRIGRQIEPDGRQPRELERTRSWDYSIMNLTGFFDLAVLADKVGLDLWNYRTSDGRSIRQALDFLVPTAAGERKWTYEQINELRPASLHALLRRAAAAWKEPRYAALAARVGGSTARTDLVIPQ